MASSGAGTTGVAATTGAAGVCTGTVGVDVATGVVSVGGVETGVGACAVTTGVVGVGTGVGVTTIDGVMTTGVGFCTGAGMTAVDLTVAVCPAFTKICCTFDTVACGTWNAIRSWMMAAICENDMVPRLAGNQPAAGTFRHKEPATGYGLRRTHQFPNAAGSATP